MPHNPLGPVCTAATVHLAAAVPNFAWMEVRISPTEAQDYPDAEVFPVQHKLEGRGSGSGFTRSGHRGQEDYLKGQTFKFWEAPHLPS